MTSASMTSLSSGSEPRPLISREGWLWIAALGGLFIALHWNFFYRMWRIATTDNNWSHALVVPLIGVYYIYQQRGRLAALPQRVCWWGLPIMFIGMLGYAAGIYPIRNDMAQGYSMILTLFGLVLFLLGPRMMSILWFPIAYLVFAVKISDRIWSQIAVQLQWIAARCATVALNVIGAIFGGFLEADVTGTQIWLVHHGKTIHPAMNVAEACAGLRMLMAFLALGVALAWLWERPWWQRLVMVLMAVPIAVAVNAGRVTVIGLIYPYNKDMATGDFHTFVGMLMLIPAALLFLLLGWVLDHIFISDHDGRKQSTPATPTALGGLNKTAATITKASIARGAAAGAVLTLLTGATLGLILAALRPDLIAENLSRSLALSLLAVSAVLLVTVIAMLPRTMPARSPGSGLPRQLIAAGVAAGVLLTASIGQGAMIELTQTVLHKKPVPLRHHLFEIDAVEPWELFAEDPPMSREMLDELGTRAYISRTYVDTDWPKGQPGRYARLHVAYYTGTADTVPHVPERCYTAGGAEYLGKNTALLRVDGREYITTEDGTIAYSELRMDEVRIPRRDITATQFRYAVGGNESNVIYFFAANGKFLRSPDHVRAQGFDPRDKYSYYCKIEVMPGDVSGQGYIGLDDPELTRRRTSDFLSAMLPEIMACLPDWTDVVEGSWPPTNPDNP